MMFDLPQPFGPTMPIMLPGSGTTVGSTNDLKPDSLMEVRRMVAMVSGNGADPAAPAASATDANRRL